MAAEFAFNKLGVKKAATIHDGSVYAEQLASVFAETFKKLGGTITAQEAVSPGDTDMRPVLTKIATGKPEFIYYPIFIAEGGHITRQAKEVAGLEKIYLMGADGLSRRTSTRPPVRPPSGCFIPARIFRPSPPATKTSSPSTRRSTAKNRMAPFHAHAYDAAMMIFAADREGGGKGRTAPCTSAARRCAMPCMPPRVSRG